MAEIRWDLLANLGSSFTNAANAAQRNVLAAEELAIERLDKQRKRDAEDRLLAAQAKVDAGIMRDLERMGGSPAAPALPAASTPDTLQPTAASPERAAARLPTFAQGSNIGSYAGAISGIESGGRYDIVGPRHPRMGRALGKYQVMEANVGPWSREALGREVSAEEFLKSPEIQDAVFQHRFGGYVQKYGSPERAAAAWFSGSPNINSGARDSLGTSVAKYVSMFGGNLRKAGGAPAPDLPATRVAMPAPDAETGLINVGERPRLAGGDQIASADPGFVPIPPPRPRDIEPTTPEGRAQALGVAAQPPVATPPTATPPPAAPAAPPIASRPVSATDRAMIGLLLQDPHTRGEGIKLWRDLRDGSKDWELGDFGPAGKGFYSKRDPSQRMMIPGSAKSDLPTDVREYEYGQKNPDYLRHQRELAAAKATQVNIDQKAASKFEEKMAEGAAKRWTSYIEQAEAANRQIGDVSTMREISRRVGSQGSTAGLKEAIGPYAESFGIDIANLSDIQAYASIVKRLAPQQRAEGSGGTSDIEYKGFLDALPRLVQHPAAREVTLDAMEALLRDQRELGQIALRLQTGEIDQKTAERLRATRPDPLTGFREWRKANRDVVSEAMRNPDPDKAASTRPPSAQNPPRKVTREEWEKLPGGTSYVAPDGSVRTKQ